MTKSNVLICGWSVARLWSSCVYVCGVVVCLCLPHQSEKKKKKKDKKKEEADEAAEEEEPEAPVSPTVLPCAVGGFIVVDGSGVT